MSLDGDYDEQNIFARMLRGELPCVKVFEDDFALAFLDIFPQARGHTLVAPKTAARNFLELPSNAVGAYMTRVHRVSKAVVAAMAPDGLVVTQFNGAPAGQSVFHLHFHLIPRYEAEALQGHGHASRADPDELERIGAMISASIT
jgi:histidine triad (HIT) family protein